MELFKAHNRYIIYHALAVALVLAVGGVIMVNTYWHNDATQKASVLENASMIAAGFDQSRILKLSGSDQDLGSPDYLYLKEKLAKIKEANKSIRFVYLAGYRDGQPFFFADSEPVDSEDYSPPGQIYEEAEPTFSEPFFTGKSMVDGIYPDRWGVWLTALAPIFDPKNPEKVIAEVGLDIDASNRSWNLLVNSSPPMLLAIFFSILILVSFMIKKHDEDMRRLREDFSSMMVHELRSPLDNIKKIITLLLKNAASKSDVEYLNFIFHDSSTMLELVNDLLDVAKLEAGKFEVFKHPYDITMLLGERAHFFETAAKFAEITITTVADSRVPKTVSIDPARISQVINNLLSNAIKFTPSRGVVSIQALFHEKGKSIIKEAEAAGITWFISENPKNADIAENSLIVAVTNTGAGISQDKIDQLFNKFKQLKSSGTATQIRGTGLGLVVVKGIVNAHGGWAGAASRVGRGSTFYFILPLDFQNN